VGHAVLQTYCDHQVLGVISGRSAVFDSSEHSLEAQDLAHVQHGTGLQKHECCMRHYAGNVRCQGFAEVAQHCDSAAAERCQCTDYSGSLMLDMRMTNLLGSRERNEVKRKRKQRAEFEDACWWRIITHTAIHSVGTTKVNRKLASHGRQHAGLQHNLRT
jgi:hypothetical protein